MNQSGSQYNRAFQAINWTNPPYYYITAHLDLTGLYTGAIESSKPYILYFNKENNYNYLNHPDPDQYGGFYPIDDQSIISEITVYANPDLAYTGVLDDLDFFIGGAYKPSVALDESPVLAAERQSLDVWGGPTGNVPGAILASELENAQVCLYGREPEQPLTDPYESEWGTRKYLALKYVLGLRGRSQRSFKAPDAQNIQRMIIRKAKERVLRPKVIYATPGEDEFESGKIYVVVKVYPKYEI